MKKIVVGIVVAILSLIVLLISLYFYMLTPVDKNDNKKIEFVVKSGEGEKVIIDHLKDKGLIKNKEAAYVYNFLNRKLTFKVGTFTLKKNMSVQKIFKTLDSGKTKEQIGINITLKEGKRYTDYIDEITSGLNIDDAEFGSLMIDTNYIKSLIDEYWFLTDDILDENIYYPLIFHMSIYLLNLRN